MGIFFLKKKTEHEHEQCCGLWRCAAAPPPLILPPPACEWLMLSIIQLVCVGAQPSTANLPAVLCWTHLSLSSSSSTVLCCDRLFYVCSFFKKTKETKRKKIQRGERK